MNGFRKSKGIVIELTALLDVILIMLFWVMMNMQQGSEDVKAEADSRVAEAQAQLEEQEKNYQQQIDSIMDDTSRQIEEAWQKAESIDSQAAKNQQALDGYEQGLLVTLNLQYDEASGVYISQGSEDIGFAALGSGDEIAQDIISAFESMGLESSDVVLCALVYDGDKALYRDVKTVTGAVEQVGNVYENFYCAYINTTK